MVDGFGSVMQCGHVICSVLRDEDLSQPVRALGKVSPFTELELLSPPKLIEK